MSRKVKDMLSVASGAPIGAKVVDGDLNHAIRKWKKAVKDSGILKEYHSRQEYVKPSVARRKVVMDAIYREKKDRS